MNAIRQISIEPRGRHISWSLLAIGVMIATVHPAPADTLQWTAPGGGVFSNPDHWDGPAAPTGDSDAVFASPGAVAYTVTFDADAASRTVTVAADNEILFDLGGFDYATGEASQSDPSRIGAVIQSIWSDGYLTVSGGEWALASPLAVGAADHTNSRLTLTAAGQIDAPRLDTHGLVTVDGNTSDLSVGLAGAAVGAGGGLALLNGGQVSVMGTVVAHGGISADGAGSSFFALGDLTVHSPLTLTDGGRAWAGGVYLHGDATVDSGGQLTANSLLRVARGPGGTSRLLGANGAMVSASTAEIQGTVVLDGGDLVAFGGIAVTDKGRLTGEGGVGGPLTVHGSGTLAPGMSIGTMQTHSVALQANSRLAVEIGSTAADRLEITGDLDLSAGSAGLAPMPVGPDLYSVGSTFSVINYTGSRSGTFGTMIGEGVYFAITYDDANKNIDVTTLAVPIPGDVNLDGVVDDNDLGIMLSNWWEMDLDWSMGDFTGDGLLGDSDLNVLLSNWTRLPGGAGTPIPEPTTLLLLAIGATAALKRRRTA